MVVVRPVRTVCAAGIVPELRLDPLLMDPLLPLTPTAAEEAVSQLVVVMTLLSPDDLVVNVGDPIGFLTQGLRGIERPLELPPPLSRAELKDCNDDDGLQAEDDSEPAEVGWMLSGGSCHFDRESGSSSAPSEKFRVLEISSVSFDPPPPPPPIVFESREVFPPNRP